MNTYTRTVKVPLDNAARLLALDEASGKRLPKDILVHVILPMLDKEETFIETMHTMKMQPRNPVRELENWCNHSCLGGFLFSYAEYMCIGHATILRLALRAASGCTVSLLCAPVFGIGACITCGRSNHLIGNCYHSITAPMMSPNWPGDSFPCARTDYRLKRSCIYDACVLANQCCCMCCYGEGRPGPEPLNGPEAMWME
jgi:hypothetical protein